MKRQPTKQDIHRPTRPRSPTRRPRSPCGQPFGKTFGRVPHTREALAATPWPACDDTTPHIGRFPPRLGSFPATADPSARCDGESATERAGACLPIKAPAGPGGLRPRSSRAAQACVGETKAYPVQWPRAKWRHTRLVRHDLTHQIDIRARPVPTCPGAR